MESDSSPTRQKPTAPPDLLPMEQPPTFDAGTRCFESAEAIEAIRRRLPGLDVDRNESTGCFVDTKTASRLVSLFPGLSVKDGIKLVTTSKRDGIGGWGRTFALPTDAEPPAVEELESEEFFESHAPRGALEDPMDAIEGDGELRSWIHASILSRELKELGAWWHGIWWGTHAILDENDIESVDAEAEEAGSLPKPLSCDWDWKEKPPFDWRPSASYDGRRIEVTFWTHSLLEVSQIIRHTDLFATDSMRPIASSQEVIATGEGGMIF